MYHHKTWDSPTDLVGRGIGEVRHFEAGRLLVRGSGGRKSPSGVQGRSPGRGPGGRSPPEAEAFLLACMLNSSQHEK